MCSSDLKTEDDLLDVEFEGKEYKVPQELKDALLRQSDYTKKTQEVAEQRKQLEQAREYLGVQAQMQQQFTKHYAQLYALDAQIEQMQKTDWNNLIESDPLQAIKLDRQMRDVQEYRNRLAGEVQQEQTKFHSQQQEWVSKQLAQANEQLVKELPGWGAELATKIKSTGASYGFTEEELSQIRDPRYVKVMHDAMKYRELQSRKPDVDKKVAKAASPNLKPSGKQSQKQTDMREMKQTLKKSGHLRDAQRIVEQML